MELDGRATTRGPPWTRRLDELWQLCKIDGTAKMPQLMTEVRKQGEGIEAWAASDGVAP